MKNLNVTFAILTAICLSSCCTMIGGAKYNATVQVKDCQKAKITVNNTSINQGEMFTHNRNIPIEILITDNNDNDSTIFNFSNNRLRFGMLCSSAIVTTLLVYGVPVPVGMSIDFATGAAFQPIESNEVVRIDYDNFIYKLDFGGCE